MNGKLIPFTCFSFLCNILTFFIISFHYYLLFPILIHFYMSPIPYSFNFHLFPYSSFTISFLSPFRYHFLFFFLFSHSYIFPFSIFSSPFTPPFSFFHLHLTYHSIISLPSHSPFLSSYSCTLFHLFHNQTFTSDLPFHNYLTFPSSLSPLPLDPPFHIPSTCSTPSTHLATRLPLRVRGFESASNRVLCHSPAEAWSCCVLMTVVKKCPPAVGQTSTPPLP